MGQHMLRTIALGVVMAVLAASETHVQTERRVIEVTAERFAFFPSQIDLAAGEEVELRIESDDTAHGFHIAGTSTNVSIPKRGQGTESVIVRFERPGRYTFECSRMCGAGHHFMRGEIVVRAQNESGQ